jgi:hypothetical protein
MRAALRSNLPHHRADAARRAAPALTWESRYALRSYALLPTIGIPEMLPI